MKAGILEESDMEDFELEEGLELCPICKVNYISEGERMCSTCLEEQTDAKDDSQTGEVSLIRQMMVMTKS